MTFFQGLVLEKYKDSSTCALGYAFKMNMFELCTGPCSLPC